MANFSWLDYTIFGVYLVASVAIGLFSARGQETMKDYFLAGQKMNRFVVAITIFAALFSGISYLAGPAEVYKNGFAFALIALSFFIATPFTTLYLLPFFYNSRYFTAYHYFQERFSLPVRHMASGLFIFRILLWLAAATYAPALALKQVTGMPLWFTILCTGSVTTIYTVFGGMKAVIWTDVLQFFVLLGGQLLIVGLAASMIPGGLAGVWDTAVADGRFNVSFSFDPRERVTFWGLIIGGAFLSLVQMATDQVSVQRYLTAGSLRDARRSLWIKLWMVLPVLFLFYGTGLVLYAFYKQHGDPIAAGFIDKDKVDQILPFFVVTQLPDGLPGLLIAAIFAASMSTTSAGINSLTSATLCDFYQTLSSPDKLTERSLLRLARWYTLLFGVLVTALAFAVASMKGNLVQSVNAIIGLIGGPMLGLFFLGMFTKRANTKGALIGCLAGFVAVLGLYLQELYVSSLPPEAAGGQKPWVSFLWYTMIGTFITMGVGWLTSSRSASPSAPHQSP